MAVAAEGLRVIFPWSAAAACGLFPPAIHVQDIGTPVAVNVTDADAMRASVALLRDMMHNPWPCWIGGVGFRIADVSLAHVHDRGTGTVDVGEHSDFAGDVGYYLVPLPAPVLPSGIDVQVHAPVLAVGHIDDVGPAVAGEVSRIFAPVVVERGGRTGGLGERDLTPPGVVGTVIDVRPRYDVHHAVVVEIGCRSRHGVVERTDLLLAEAAGGFFTGSDLQLEILVSHVPELHLPGAADV